MTAHEVQEASVGTIYKGASHPSQLLSLLLPTSSSNKKIESSIKSSLKFGASSSAKKSSGGTETAIKNRADK